MSGIDTYHQRKARLVELYRQLQEAPFLPLEIHGKTLTADSLGEDLERLEAEKFVVSVCGQVNVGKSTFINALLFDDEILPAADTVETAKLSEITYQDTPSYEIVLYSPEEWRALQAAMIDREDGTQVSYYEAYLKPSIDNYIQASGELIYPEQILAQQVIRGEDLTELRQFISANGKYTPFVRYVRIGYPAEILKEVTFVDTPGTNDPNPLRSKVTLDWIGSSDAVIFLMYSGAALDRQDKTFIDRYLLPVPSDRILIALSKADIVEDYSRPKEYVERVLAGVPGFASTLKHKSPYAIAPVFSLYPKLLERHERGAIQLAPQKLSRIQHQLWGRADKDFTELIEKEGFIPEFREAIAAHLVSTKGEGILASHAQKIRATYEYAVEAQRLEVAKLSQSLADAWLSEQELRDRQQALGTARAKLNTMMEVATDQQTEILKGFRDATRHYVSVMSQSLQKKAASKIEKEDFHRLKHNLAWDLKSMFEGYAETEFKKQIEGEFKIAKNKVQLVFDRLKQEAFNLQLFDGVFLQLMFRQFFISELLESVSKTINERFSEAFLESQRVKKFFFFDNKEEIASRVDAAIKAFFDTDGSWGQAVLGYAHEQFRQNVSNTFKDVTTALQTEIARLSTEVDALLANLDSKTQRASELQVRLRELEGEVEALQQDLARINRELEMRPVVVA